MRRVFAVDVLECPRDHGPMKILAAISPPDAAGASLECLGSGLARRGVRQDSPFPDSGELAAPRDGEQRTLSGKGLARSEP